MTRIEKILLLLLPLPFGIGFLTPGVAQEPIASQAAFHFTDPEIVESSGLVARDGLVVTVNDSGDSNRVFTVDPATGDTVGVTRWQGEATDIEALAPASAGHVWVGDTGDNMEDRDSIRVTEVPVGRGDREVRATTYRLTYPDGAHDAETLMTDPATGRLYVVTKGFIGRVFAAPAKLDPDGTNELTPVDEVLGIATDGAFLPDGRHLVVRNYHQAAIYTWPALGRVALMDLPAQQQGEGIAVREDGEVLLSSEGAESDVLRVELPADVRAALAEVPAAADEAPDEAADEAPTDAYEDQGVWWPWALGGVAGLVMVGVLLRSLRPR
ncbi:MULTISPECIES: hypothetical protein [unclassified Nocardioides]|uniref:hypothetical protein n=1 Tax=unclassified Nocardioides TaxID=2615069 RepID=UPI000702A897|nr:MULTISPECIES: hypothetical protein [unclassified Nocardioides]KRC52687.1 hypothetical protein ASE19_09650 [Nocardioides sp. Root79]KRC72219.1 hypothetical protein ASE20_06185 [Nocardioides sp. Root240]